MSKYLTRNSSGELVLASSESSDALAVECSVDDNFFLIVKNDETRYESFVCKIKFKNSWPEEYTEEFEIPIKEKEYRIDLALYLKPSYETNISIDFLVYDENSEVIAKSYQTIKFTLKKEFTLERELVFNDDGYLREYLGKTNYLKYDFSSREKKGVFSLYWSSSNNRKLDIVFLNIEEIFGGWAFTYSNIHSISIYTKELFLYDSAFSGFKGILKISKNALVHLKSPNVFDRSSLKEINFRISREDLSFTENVFKNTDSLEKFDFFCENNTKKEFFGESYFSGMEFLKEIDTYDFFEYSGKIPEKCFYKCKKLEYINDKATNSINRYIIPIEEAGRFSFAFCEELPKKNVFVLYPESKITSTTFTGMKKMTVLYNGSEPDSEVIKKFNLQADTYICRMISDKTKTSSIEYLNQLKNINSKNLDYLLESNKNFVFFSHRLGQKSFYNHILKYVGNDESLNLKDFSRYIPFRIEKYAFLNNENLKYLYIPKGDIKINKSAFEGCKDLTICCEAYPEEIEWLSAIPENLLEKIKFGMKEETFYALQRRDSIS